MVETSGEVRRTENFTYRGLDLRPDLTGLTTGNYPVRQYRLHRLLVLQMKRATFSSETLISFKKDLEQF